METAVLNTKGEKIGMCELPESVFGQKPKPHFLHEVVRAYLSNQRLGTACVKTRAEVSGGGKKPWKQKHTGRARQGSTRSPVWTKGGVAFGPRPHSYFRDMPVAKKRLALAQALSAKLAEGNLVVVDRFEVAQPKTRDLGSIIRLLDAGRKPLVVSMKQDKNLKLAGRNIEGFSHQLPAGLNAYVVLDATKVVMTRDAVEALGSSLKQEGK